MYILYHITTLHQLGNITYNSLADAETGKQNISNLFSEYSIAAAEKAELMTMRANKAAEAERAKAKRHAALKIAQSTMQPKRITLRVVGN